VHAKNTGRKDTTTFEGVIVCHYRENVIYPRCMRRKVMRMKHGNIELEYKMKGLMV
jgi:hypothetical protein